MKRRVASRRLKRKCQTCGREFKKGDVYYKHREVIFDFDFAEIIAFEFIQCPKCKYKHDSHNDRFERFKSRCHHPITHEVWSYIPGEAVMQPDHDECLICGKWV
ncbi:hypothetical protein PB1_16339 [Bacillus methanolicus PB1]|uniref:Uncharacterized protein n=1 Tax=Bacillus methanolicus PB1 TaxID=997296 RepID=I3DY22_BACMT|nr:hypothetical protein PB1_16339 [Bacillus methanolicus PB1]